MISMIGVSFLFVSLMMFLLWCTYVFKRNAGIVDIGWALGFIIAVWTYFILSEGVFFRKLLIASLVTLWAGRLAIYLISRFLKSPEDPRYVKIRENWGGDPTNIKFLLMFLFQGALLVLLSFPFLLICRNTQSGSLFEGVGVVVWFIGVLGEAVADRQLSQFKKSHKEGVCQSGLWRISRHPNYFFEWIVWVGYFFIALPAPGGLVAIVSPLIILYLLIKVSGIPLAEARLLKSKGDSYREYQQTTSSFFPWFPAKKG